MNQQGEEGTPNRNEGKSSFGGAEKIVRSRGAIITLLFGVTGVLGLPLLWISPSFSVQEKLIYSIVVTIYTCILIAIVVWIIWWAVGRINGTI